MSGSPSYRVYSTDYRMTVLWEGESLAAAISEAISHREADVYVHDRSRSEYRIIGRARPTGTGATYTPRKARKS